jgi:hypothetical protein
MKVTKDETNRVLVLKAGEKELACLQYNNAKETKLKSRRLDYTNEQVALRGPAPLKKWQHELIAV